MPVCSTESELFPIDPIENKLDSFGAKLNVENNYKSFGLKTDHRVNSPSIHEIEDIGLKKDFLIIKNKM